MASQDHTTDDTKHRSILEPGRNCWRVERASRLAPVIDGEHYFRAVREAILAARHVVFVVGWDIHSQLRMVRDDSDGEPERLGELLDYVARERGVDVYVLCWDYAMVYWAERERLPRFRLGWQTHSHVHFHMDSHHPVGASQHQKTVVIDDYVAFNGGFDLSKWRWDTREHRPEDERRRDPDGDTYPPFHDVQLAVEGDVAAALGKQCRQRWERATGEPPPERREAAETTAWPACLEPILCDQQVAIARTLPQYKEVEEVREVEQLYLDMVAAARHWIYIENQYLSAHSIGEALAARLKEKTGPEIVVVLPFETGGWLEQHTMDVLRGRLVKRLKDADRHDRLRIYYPRIAAGADSNLMVHAKLMVVDDHILRIGSANLSNRSMGLDSECDLVIEGRSKTDRDAISRVRNDLLAEHLGATPEAVAQALERHGSLIGAIEELARHDRRLAPLETSVPNKVDKLVPDAAVIDPEKPVAPEELVERAMPVESEAGLPWRNIFAALLLLLFASLAAAWQWTDLGQWLDIEELVAQARSLSAHPFTPALAAIGIAVAATLAVPITLLVIASVTAFGPFAGFAYALLGGEISALLTYALGAVVGKDFLRRHAGDRLDKVSKVLARRGILTMITLRLVPVAPFVIINLIAGASRISFRDYLLGTLFGMAPGMLMLTLFAEGIISALSQPDPIKLAGILLALVLAVFGFLFIRHRLQERRR